MILHENRLPADDSHEISCLICYFCKKSKICNCRLLQIIGGALRVNIVSVKCILWQNILRKTIEGYLESVSSLTFNTMKTLLIMHVFHSSRHLQSKWMLYFSHASMV